MGRAQGAGGGVEAEPEDELFRRDEAGRVLFKKTDHVPNAEKHCANSLHSKTRKKRIAQTLSKLIKSDPLLNKGERSRRVRPSVRPSVRPCVTRVA
ncbi:hypothetical protein L596_020638 [Steinernema carpocapsae]|uniref:Uncharacterized protein n=1 Tax=Steinernema carpocapsae TaxID=34508 RepID=A0A4V6A0Z5_STECR|nr:hypothetical protein L596_020638 [Steinernema carpocapsae]